MRARQLKLVNLLIWSGVLLLLLGIQLNLSYFAPYINSVIHTAEIPTAPPMTVARAESEQDAVVLLPFEDSPGTGGKSVQVNAPTVVATWTPTPMPTPVVLPTSTPLPPRPTLTAVLPTPTLVPPTATPVPPMSTPSRQGTLPTRIRIVDINLDAPVVPIGWEVTRVDGIDQAMWQVPDWHAAGWHNTSAKIGVPGNTVLNGHNTTRGEVFRDIYTLEPGALIEVDGADGALYTYRVHDVYILPEAGQPIEVRMQNALYIQPTEDERLTLVTCHPYGSLRNRLIVIAYPVSTLAEGE